MNSTQDVILGVLGGPWCGFEYPGVEAYLVSIQRSGFTGRKVMLVWQIRLEVKKKLIEYGFEVIDIKPRPPEPFFHARMRLAWEYLKAHHQEFRFVFWLDIKDLVLQSDPSVWMEEHIGDAKIVGSTECVTIEQENTNQLWARTILGDAKYQAIKNAEVINCGTWAGEAEVMSEVFHQVHLGCTTYRGPYPPCQIWLNYVLRQKPFVNMLRIPRWSEGFAACLHPVWWVDVREHCYPYLRDEYPTIDPNTAVLYPGVNDPSSECIKFSKMWRRTENFELVPKVSGVPLGVECVSSHSNKPFVIVHGYDRDWGMKWMFDFKYSFEKDFDFVKYREERDLLCKQSREGPRALRRPDVSSLSVGGSVHREFKRKK